MTDEERERLRRVFDVLPKVPIREESALERRNEILPGWVMAILEEPYDVYTSVGEHRTILTGRMAESRQWTMSLFVGNPETGRFLSAYHNRDLEEKYGWRPWRNR